MNHTASSRNSQRKIWEEIYGLGISTTWGSDDLMWCNEGWGSNEIQAKASEEQKLHFKRAVEIIEQIVNEYK